MSLSEVADLIGAVLIFLGCFLCFSAAVGLVRFPDVLTRMHAATKPQTLGLLVIVIGVAVSLREPVALGMLFLIAVLQLLTAPVAAHMVARAAYRSNQVENGAIVTDELAEDLARAGFSLQESGRSDDDEQDQRLADHLDPGDLDAEEGRAAGTDPAR
ncbi:MAG: monovalent cation/H(+) antiporter subunit G [Propionibacteriales bacterium]|nr:monovalent cation/H(+) antiporter subunit G [Propionibacteriales bacterium]